MIDPYAPPQHERIKLAHDSLKYLLGAVLAPLPVAVILVLALGEEGHLPASVVALACWVGAFAAWLLWIHRTQRFLWPKKHGGVPGILLVVLAMCVPCFALVYNFVLHHRIARSVDAKVTKYGASARAPLALAWIAPAWPVLVTIVGFLLILGAPEDTADRLRHVAATRIIVAALELVLPFLFFVFMAKVDRCNEAIAVARLERRARKRPTTKWLVLEDALGKSDESAPEVAAGPS